MYNISSIKESCWSQSLSKYQIVYKAILRHNSETIETFNQNLIANDIFCHLFTTDRILISSGKKKFWKIRWCTSLKILDLITWVRVAQWVRWLDYITTHTSLSPIRRGFAPRFVNDKKVCTRLAAQVIKFTSCLPMVGGFLRVLRLFPLLIVVAMI